MTVLISKAVDEAIEQITSTTPANQIERTIEMVNNDKEITRRHIMDDAESKRVDAEFRQQSLERRVADLAAEIRDVTLRFAATDCASFLCALITTVGASACLVSESKLGLSIPYVLNIPPNSFGGLLMGVAMACSALMLDQVAQKLDLTANPWEVFRRVEHQALRWIVSGLLVLFLVGISVVNVLAVLNIVPVREEAMKLQHQIENSLDDTATVLDEGKIRHALEWYSLLVVMGAALLTTAAVGEIRLLARRRNLRMNRTALRTGLEKANESLAAAASAHNVAKLEFGSVEDLAIRHADIVGDERLLKIDRAKERKREVDMLQFVDRCLATGKLQSPPLGN